MLDADTKRRIDTARDILVGKIPDPKSQVEQITIALIYKFMDDMDAQSEEWGGERSFFAGDFARYRWAKLTAPGLGGYEVLNLYTEAIIRMSENPGIPPMFREIFNNAYLPYRDPETLRSFLKIIGEFEYDHSERLGDAFEYLLSVLGAQGDAGQFRTPRHIIDFMVDIVDPQKGETVLDPACGTAGFLISAYKRILDANKDGDGRSTLIPDEMGRLADDFRGYDISPDMVRLSSVNMYLHGFREPHVHEYDTLTSEERWNEYADVILANPPFMSPRGGIRPHSRFSVQSNRSEVLFVDYIAEHLTPNGRAGVIVPEGVVFQSQNAYKQLRKMLVEEYLVAVISLPTGVFRPYSGVKTSILIMDKSLARKTDSIAFFKVENDGFDLGARRGPIVANDLPHIQYEIERYLRMLRTGEAELATSSRIAESGAEYTANKYEITLGVTVEKDKIAADGDYNLSGERYRETRDHDTHWPMVALSDIATMESGSRQKGGAIDSGVPSIGGAEISEDGTIRFEKMKFISENHFRGMSKGVLCVGDVLLVKDGATTGKTGYFDKDVRAAVNEHVFILRSNKIVLPYYLYSIVRSDTFQDLLKPYIKGIIGGVSREIGKIEIPLPPLEVQSEIVAEIEGCQNVIDGARAVIDNWRPHITVDSEWPRVALGEKDVFSILSGGTPKSDVKEYWDGDIPWITLADLPQENFITEISVTQRTISDEGLRKSSANMIPENSVVVSSRATIGRIGISRIPLATNQGFKNIVIEDTTRAVPEYVALALTKLVPDMEAQASGATFKEIIKSRFVKLQIPLPPLDIQQSIVAEMETEQTLVKANTELIQRMEERMEASIARVWRTEEATDSAGV